MSTGPAMRRIIGPSITSGCVARRLACSCLSARVITLQVDLALSTPPDFRATTRLFPLLGVNDRLSSAA